MSVRQSASAGLVPVHVGQPIPGSEAEMSLLAQWERTRERMTGRAEDHLRIPGDLNWERHGLQPRWLGQESSDCSVAIDPGYVHGRGADERDRFLAGGRARDELALVIAGVGDADHDQPRNVFATHDASVHVAGYTSVDGQRLPTGTPLQLAPNLSSVDRDLGLRLLNRRTEGSQWWSLKLHGVTTIRGDGFGGETHHPAEGQLEPILVDGLGAPAVAAWVSQDGGQRWYIIPDGTEWDTVLDWLIQQALPELVPGALRRVRSAHFTDPDLQTREELGARAALEECERRYADEHSALQQRLSTARERADMIRDGLLYGTGEMLVRAVASVLTDGGVHVVDLDNQLGGTRSADLLITGRGSRRRLVEVKSASGSAKEDLTRDLERHLATWPHLRAEQPVDGGVLIVNHQHRLHPVERSPEVYARREFVDALKFPVLTTWQLFRWWADEDLDAIVRAVLVLPNPESLPEGRARQKSRRPWARGKRAPSPPDNTF